MIVMQAVLVYHYSSDEDLLVNDIDFKLKIWTSEYLEKNKPVLYLDRLQSYVSLRNIFYIKFVKYVKGTKMF